MTDSPANPVAIRRLIAGDAAEFKRLRLRGLSEHPDLFTSSPQDWDLPLDTYVARIEAGHLLGAFDRSTNALLGHVFLLTHQLGGTKLRHKCDVGAVYVVPEARGLGIAKALMIEAITVSRQLGFAWLRLRMSEHNQAARRLYEGLGFTVFGCEEDYVRMPDGRSTAQIMMHKRL